MVCGSRCQPAVPFAETEGSSVPSAASLKASAFISSCRSERSSELFFSVMETASAIFSGAVPAKHCEAANTAMQAASRNVAARRSNEAAAQPRGLISKL